MNGKSVLFTDIDGTLIDHDTYQPGPVRETVRRVQAAGVSVVLCSARTRVEQKWLRRDLGIEGPFIVENGGAIFFPKGYFSEAIGTGELFESLRFGMSYDKVRSGLHQAATAAGLRVRGYGDMALEEVSNVTGLDLKAAHRAKAREFTESFLILDGGIDTNSGAVNRLGDELARMGMTLSRGTRFWSAMGEHDKGRAVRHLSRILKKHFGPIRTYGIGDYFNDISMFEAVDVPLLLERPGGGWADINVPNLRQVSGAGPQGWCRGVEVLLEQLS